MNPSLALFVLLLCFVSTFCQVFDSEEKDSFHYRERNCLELCSQYEQDASKLSNVAVACVHTPHLCPELFVGTELMGTEPKTRMKRQTVNYTAEEISIFRSVSQLVLGTPNIGPLPVPTTAQWKIDCAGNAFLLKGTLPSQIGLLTFIKAIDFLGCQLSGTIPSEVGLLKNGHLSIFSAQLTGTLPSELGNLAYVEFSFNQLTGTIPSEFGRISSSLSLSNNLLTGTLPSELGSISDQVDVSTNSLEGTLPIINASRAGARPAWYAGFNRLSGTIPSEFGRTQILSLGNNNLTGTIPETLANVLLLYLSNNLFQSEVPLALFRGRIMYLDLSGCGLAGTIPSLSGSWNLLALDRNKFSGTIPSSIGGLAVLQAFSIDTNQITGTIPTELFRLRRLRILDFESNQLSGTIPTEVGSVASLQALRLANNRLGGMIPTQLGNMENLRSIDLHGNFLTISENFPWNVSCSVPRDVILANNNITVIPRSLLKSCPATAPYSSGSSLDLSENFITEQLFPGYNVSSTTDKVYFSHQRFDGNRIYGTISYLILQATGLSTLNLARNRVSGTIPFEVSYSDGSTLSTLILNDNNLSGTIPLWIMRTTKLNSVIGFSNQLTDFEEGFFVDPLPKILDFTSNRIASDISIFNNLTTSNLKRFGLLALGGNQITGDVGSSVFRYSVISPVYMFNNHLNCINLPLWCAGSIINQTGTGQCFPCRSKCGDGLRWDSEECDDGNNLDGDGCSSTCQVESDWECHEEKVIYIEVVRPSPSICSQKGSSNTTVIVATVVPIICGIILLLMALFLCWTVKQKNSFEAYYKKKLQTIDSHFMIMEEDLELNDVIGEGNFGRVHIGTLRGTTRVAVKVLKEKEEGSKVNEDMEKREHIASFINEARLMSSIPPHPNVVPFIGVCLSKEKQTLYLVTQYISQGSLQRYIFQNVMLKNSDLLEIILGTCAGMRHLSYYSIKHNDLSARNILIEEVLLPSGEEGESRILVQPKVSDFGLAASRLSKNKKMLIPIRWCAPELVVDSRNVSEHSDIWSFGVLMWEVMTRCTVMPYSTIPGGEVYNHINQGNRLEAPDPCDPQLYDIMKLCWTWEPEKRPSFAILHKSLLNLSLKLEPDLSLRLSHKQMASRSIRTGGAEGDRGTGDAYEQTPMMTHTDNTGTDVYMNANIMTNNRMSKLNNSIDDERSSYMDFSKKNRLT